MKRLLIVPLAIILVGYATSSCSSSASKDKERNDSIAAEAARLDSLRQDSIIKDSIAFYEFTSPDLCLFDVRGHVREMSLSMNTHPNITAFDYVAVNFSYDGEMLFCAGANNPIRNKNGIIIGYYANTNNEYKYDIEWAGNKISSTTYCYSETSKINTKPTYQNGKIIAYNANLLKRWENFSETSGTIEYISSDEHGNWTLCIVKEKTIYPAGTIDYYGNNISREPVFKTDTIKRVIKYYSRVDSSTEDKQAKKEFAEFQKHHKPETNSSRIPDWIQGTWHLDINGPNGISVANYTITIDGDYATMLDGSRTKYSGECHIDNGKLFLGNASSFEINGQSLYYRQYRLTKEGGSSSWSGSFRTDSDVMRYLTDRTFYSGSHRMSFTYNSCKIDGYAVSGAPRISNFSSTSATIVVNPIGGGRAAYLYLNASNGTINYEGDIFRAR